MCRRPCLFFARGECRSGPECRFCHLEHDKRLPHADKRRRAALQEMEPERCKALILPLLWSKAPHRPRPPACFDRVSSSGRPRSDANLTPDRPHKDPPGGPRVGLGSAQDRHRLALDGRETLVEQSILAIVPLVRALDDQRSMCLCLCHRGALVSSALPSSVVALLAVAASATATRPARPATHDDSATALQLRIDLGSALDRQVTHL